MKYLLILLLSFLCVQSFAQEDTTKYMKYPNSYGPQYKDLWATRVMRLPDTTGHRPMLGAPGAIGRNAAGTQVFIWDGSQWNASAGGMTIDSVFITSIDSIFITNTDSIFIVSGNDTIFIGESDHTRDTAKLFAQYGIIIHNEDSTYAPNGLDVAIGIDTSVLRTYITQVVNEDTTIINNGDSIPALIVDTISKSPPAGVGENYKVIVGSASNGTIICTGLTGVFVGHCGEIAEHIGSVWVFTAPECNQQVIVDNSLAYSTWQYKCPSNVWRQTSILWRVNGNSGIGTNAFLGRKDKQPLFFRAWNLNVMKLDTTRDVYLPKFSGVDTSNNFMKFAANGRISYGHFDRPVYATPALSDSVMYVQSGVIKYGTVTTGGGGGGTVTSIATTSPITGGTITTTGTIGINNAAADGSTKGAASFTDNDFDASSGNISIDYANGQKVSTTLPGFVTAGGSANKILHGDGSWKDTSAIVQFTGLANRLPYWNTSTNIAYFDSIFTSNSSTSVPKIGFGASPTRPLTFDSTRSLIGNGMAFFRTANISSNYSGMGFYYQGSTFNIASISAGTGTASPINLNSGSTQINSAGTQINTGSLIASSTLQGPNLITTTINTADANKTVSFAQASTASSGNAVFTDVRGQVSESGTAGRTVLRISPFFSTIGSGNYYLLDAGENTNAAGTGIHTSSFTISKAGVVSVLRERVAMVKPIAFSGTTPSNSAGTGAGTSPTITVTGNDAAGYVTIATGTSPTASGDIVTITFSTALTNTPTSIQLTPANEAAATELTKFYVDQASASSSSWKIKNTSSALTASTTYKFYYTVTQ